MPSTRESGLATGAAPVPAAPGGRPLIGHTAAMLRNPLTFINSLAEHGDLVRIRFGPVQLVVVCGPDLTRQVLMNDRVFDKGGPLYDRARDLLGDGLGTCRHDEHRRQRRLIQPAFHHSRMPGYAQAMAEQIEAVVGAWEDGQVIDVRSQMQLISARALMATMFSASMPADLLQQAVDDVNVFIAGVYRNTISPAVLNRLPIPANRRYRQAIGRLRSTIADIIAERRAHPGEEDDLLSVLQRAELDADDETSADRRRFSDSELRDQVVLFLLAGSESTSTTLAWSFHLVAEQPAIRDRWYAEVDSVIQGAATIEDLPELPLTGHIITECLRLYAPAGMVTRTTMADTELGGYRITAGTSLIISPHLIHHRPEVHQQPEAFDPDRWSAPSGLARPGPTHEGYIPFGAGARKCIGEQFAVTEIALALATIAARWELQPLPGPAIQPSSIFGMHPKGLRMRARARVVPALNPAGQSA